MPIAACVGRFLLESGAREAPFSCQVRGVDRKLASG